MIPVLSLRTRFLNISLVRRTFNLYLPQFTAVMHSASCMSTKQQGTKPKVYVTRAGCPSEGINMLKEKYDIETWKEACSPIPQEELIKGVKGKDALLCLLTDKIDKAVLDSAGPSLKVIATLSVGFDHIDVEEVKKRGIKLGNTPFVSSNSVAELTVALLLVTARRLIEAHGEVLNGGWGTWSPLWLCGSTLDFSTVGIVGMGLIGQEVAKRVKAFNTCKILYTDSEEKPEACEIGAKKVDLDELLRESDFVSMNCALTSESKGMCNEAFFSKMKSDAIFINTGRGGLVDQEALLKALKEGKIAGAGLDVTLPEPIPTDHPLLKLENCVIFPHIGSSTYKAREAMCVVAAQNIIHGLEGKPLPAPV